MSGNAAIVSLVALTVLVIAAAVLSPRTPQPLSYHNVADHRVWLGLPDFGDVASNLACAIFGIWGAMLPASSHAAGNRDPIR